MPLTRPRLIGLPYDASSSFLRGSAEAPPRIRAALASTAGNTWTQGLRDLAGPDGLGDAGDLELPPTAAARPLIEAGIAAVLADGARPHAPLTILHIDAHPDLYDVFEGDRFSHACPFARILEDGLAARLVQVGIRTMSGRQHASPAGSRCARSSA